MSIVPTKYRHFCPDNHDPVEVLGTVENDRIVWRANGRVNLLCCPSCFDTLPRSTRFDDGPPCPYCSDNDDQDEWAAVLDGCTMKDDCECTSCTILRVRVEADEFYEDGPL